ncbi:MAG: MFS transporter [Bacteroidia bacterium]|jgi:UMF1 family MFS transporter|nr:MFS transporter [Bacteroidia bacterium]
MDVELELDDPKKIKAWTFYDWANSAYSLVISSALFPIYFSAITDNNGSRKVEFLGRTFNSESLLSYAISFSFLVIALVSPMLSSIADYSGQKKKFMFFFSTLGAISCSLLWFFEGIDTLWVGILCSMLAAIGYAGSIVFYNAYLPELVSEEDQDYVSARGFSMGYIGSSLLLIFNLTMILFPDWYGGIEKGTAMRFSFLLVGVWWFGFAQYSFANLPKDPKARPIQSDILSKGYRELKTVWKQLQSQPSLKMYLIAFLFFNMAVQTVMYLATLFGVQEIAWPDEESKQSGLIVCILLIQFVAIGGAFLFSALSARFGNIKALIVSIVVWMLICTAVYKFVYVPFDFYLTAAFVGMVMGGIQSLSRSTYSKLLPPTNDHASYFSFYDVCDKVGTVLGTFIFGYINEITGSMRQSIVALIVFFIIGIILLLRVQHQNRILEMKFNN